MADASEAQEQQEKQEKKAPRKASRKRAKKGGVDKQLAPSASFDRSQLGEKTRVFQLAKALRVPSKELIVALSEMGVVKVAQSSLTRAEAEQLLDALAAEPATEPEAADEKIRDRVRKDVANEITQIERKVDAELSESISLDDDTDALADPEDITDAAGPAGEGEDAEPLTDVEPDVTPAPEEDAAAYAPLFKAPRRSGRRRASRPAETAATAAPADTAERSEVAEEAEAVEAAEAAEAAEAVEVLQEPKAIKGSSRLEAQRRRRSEKREEERKRSRIVSQAEFLARRESVTRTMVVRERDRHDGAGKITQVGVLEDGLLVEHFVTSDQQASMIGNIYLGRVQNVLPSMEAAFIDIGQGRNGVLYAGEVDWKAAGLGGRSRRIEHALKSGDHVVVQVTKDPVGHKGARLTTQISLAGRFLVYVPGGRSAGISRKLPAPERKRLKEILAKVVPGKGGAIIRTAAEGVPEDAIAADVNRLHTQWESIQELAEKHKKAKGAKPVTLYEEPNLLVKVVRDLFNEDFSALIVDGKKPWNTVNAYVQSVAPDLLDRLERFDRNEHGGKDAFEVYRVDEQIQKALSRSVWLPSGGSLIIDRTEAMTVIDVNTGKFTGSGGSLEETVTSNNLEAAEEIVRQIRLRDIGGIIIIDFIDMILPENQDLVLRRLKEALGRDRTKHQVSEVTSLGLVQLTRKRLGTGLLETFSEPCEHCGGRGIVLAEDPIDPFDLPPRARQEERRPSRRRGEKEPLLADEELEAIADSVVTDAPEERRDDDGAEVFDGREGEKRSRRRGRRGGSRGRGNQASQVNKANQVNEERGRAATAAAAEQHDAPEKSPETAESAYEAAVAEFEASPRRKRRTRGNSRSDHRPRREDFVDKQREERSEDRGEARSEEKPGEKPEVKQRSARGRRRATRKSGASARVETQTAKREAEKKSGRAEQRAEGGSERGTQSAARRGRRRATRRSTSS